MKRKKLKKKYLFISLVIVILIILAFGFFNSSLIFKANVKVQVNSYHTLKEYIKKSKNVTVDKTQVINTAKLGKQSLVVNYKTKISQNQQKTFKYTVVDTEKPTISIDEEIVLAKNSKDNLVSQAIVKDNSLKDVQVTIIGDYDLTKAGEYKLKIAAIDASGNKATKDFTLKVEETQNSATQTKADTNQLPYYIKINRQQNVVMVYGLENGEYTKLVKVFTCSTGKATPVGTFKTTDKYEWRPLFGDVYGQYATRITGSILFHSVPYTKQSKDSLEWEEYNKLGTPASMGCIRLRVVDVKWIYDNCPKGTTVTIYDSDSLEGIEKPVIKLIDENSQNKGWDPTDPDPLNPW